MFVRKEQVAHFSGYLSSDTSFNNRISISSKLSDLVSRNYSNSSDSDSASRNNSFNDVALLLDFRTDKSSSEQFFNFLRVVWRLPEDAGELAVQSRVCVSGDELWDSSAAASYGDNEFSFLVAEQQTDFNFSGRVQFEGRLTNG